MGWKIQLRHGNPNWLSGAPELGGSRFIKDPNVANCDPCFSPVLLQNDLFLSLYRRYTYIYIHTYIYRYIIYIYIYIYIGIYITLYIYADDYMYTCWQDLVNMFLLYIKNNPAHMGIPISQESNQTLKSWHTEETRERAAHPGHILLLFSNMSTSAIHSSFSMFFNIC